MMAFLSFESVATTVAVKTVAALTVPANATHASLQARTQPCSYTMDGSTDPTQTAGMQLGVDAAGMANPPEEFLIEDVRNIRFMRGVGADGLLNIHYFAGRNV
jgi:hypothetical protein